MTKHQQNVTMFAFDGSVNQTLQVALSQRRLSASGAPSSARCRRFAAQIWPRTNKEKNPLEPGNVEALFSTMRTFIIVPNDQTMQDSQDLF